MCPAPLPDDSLNKMSYKQMPGSAASSDPFAVGMDALGTAVEQLQGTHARWGILLTTTNTQRNMDFKAADDELKRKLKRAEEDLGLLERTVKHVESRRANFEHIDDEELARRHRMLAETKAALAAIKDGKDGIFSSTSRRKIEQDTRDHTRAMGAEAQARGVSRKVVENDHFVRGEQQSQELMVRQQDDQLDTLAQGVGRLGNMAHVIKDEVEEQSKMLDELDEDLDAAAEKMGRVLGTMAKLLKTKDRGIICVVLGLCVLLVILVFVTFYL